MAPRRGGGGGGGGRGGGGSSCDPMKSDFPCTTQLHYIYGSRVASQFTQSELYGQVVLYSIWCLALVVIYFFSVKPQHRWLPGLRLGILSYICAYIFLIVRYALIISESDVPFDYRYESSVVVMLERLGMVFLLGGAFPGPEARHVTKLVFWPFLAILAALNIAYFVLDFLISADAIAAMKDSITWSWHLSDRDFGLINTPHAINELIMNGRTRLSPYYVEERMYDISDERGWQTRRDAQIKTGVAADFLALILAVGLLVMAATPRILRRKTEGSSRKGTIFLLVASAGLVLAALFRVIIATHYVLWNWNSVADASLWLEWVGSFTSVRDPHFGYSVVDGGPDSFLPGYRTVVDGFWIIHALFGPLGIVLACLGTVLWQRERVKMERLDSGSPFGMGYST